MTSRRGVRDRVDGGLDLRTRDLARRLLDVDVVGRQHRLELVLVEREERRDTARRRPAPSRGGGGTPRARSAAARDIPRSRGPARSARRWSRRCSRGAPAPRRSGRRPRRDGRRCTARHPSANARSRRTAPGCRSRATRGSPLESRIASWATALFRRPASHFLCGARELRLKRSAPGGVTPGARCREQRGGGGYGPDRSSRRVRRWVFPAIGGPNIILSLRHPGARFVAAQRRLGAFGNGVEGAPVARQRERFALALREQGRV